MLERIDDRSRDDYDNAGRLILELDALDPNGQHFRYAWTRRTKAKGAARTPPTPTLAGVNELCLDRIHTALTGLAGFLEAAEAQVDDLISAAPPTSEW